MRFFIVLAFVFNAVFAQAEDFNAEAVEAQVMAEIAKNEKTPNSESVANGALTSSQTAEAGTENLVAVEQEGKVENTKNENLKEDEIPLNLDKAKKAASEGSGFFRIIFTLSILGVLGTGAFFFIRKYKVPKGSVHQTQIKVIQQHYLGPKKSLAIVRVAGESILIGVTDTNISMIKSLALLDDEIPEVNSQNFQQAMVDQDLSHEVDQNELESYLPKKKAKNKDLDFDEEFAISGVKDIVSKRLKNMRTL